MFVDCSLIHLELRQGNHNLFLNGRVIGDDTVLSNLVIEDAVLHAVLNLRGD